MSPPPASGRVSGREAEKTKNSRQQEKGRKICASTTMDDKAVGRDGGAPRAGARLPDVTTLLVEWRSGDERAMQELVPLVHDELRRLARRHMAGERPGHVLQATALVNEVYLRLIDIRRIAWQDRAHFFAVAARLMRRVLVDAARAQKNQKRGGALHRVTLDPNLPVASGTPEDVITIDAALEALAAGHERKARVVELRFFGGLSVDETAEVLKVSEETVTRDWRFAKAWLLRELSRTGRSG
jgi:RNA polymerase sigma-70 factor, ECF subfamily